MRGVLIADDEPVEREGLSFLINERYNAYIHTAPNGKDALTILRKSPIDVLITDIRMPYMDGLELAHCARSENERLHILLYTAYSDFEYARKAIKVRIEAYLLKPLSDAALYEELDSILELREGRVAPKQEIDVVHNAQDYMREHFFEDITLDDIAGASFVTPNYLCYVFKQKTGLTPMRYLASHRMKRAVSMLENTDMRITDVMLACGYSNPSYFSSVFKSEYGCTPSEYRAKLPSASK